MSENQSGVPSTRDGLEGEATPTPTEEGTQPSKSRLWWTIGAIAFAILLVWGISKDSPSSAGNSSVSGTIDFNGLKPTEKNQVNGKIVLMEKETGTEDFQQVDTQIPFEDNATWHWNSAQEGKTYDIKIDLYFGDDLIKSSSIITVTAPATNQILILEVTIEDIPQQILDEAEVSISGTLDINGYVPAGSTITIFQRLASDENTQFQAALEDVTASDNMPWSWDSAKPGKEYKLKATMYYKTQIIGESEISDAVAPAENETLRIHSNAKDPSEEVSASISGVVQISGPIADDSVVVLYQKKYGTEYTEFSEFGKVPAIDNSTWKWSDAIQGERYEIQSALESSGAPISYSNQVLVTAPAKNEVLAIDTNFSLKNPSDKPEVSCGSKDDTGHFNATVTYDRIDKANFYSLEVGEKPGKHDVKHELKEQTTKSDPELEFLAKDGKSYYAQYAYSACTACDLEDRQNWSGYSPTLGFVCTEEGAEEE